MTLKKPICAMQTTLLSLAIAVAGFTAQPGFAKGGGIKPAFTAAAKGAGKSGSAAGSSKRPLPKKSIQPHGKPKMNPGLPKSRPKPTRAQNGKKPAQLKQHFNKAARPKPLREIFNPAARPPKRPVKGDPPPNPVLRPKGPTF